MKKVVFFLMLALLLTACVPAPGGETGEKGSEDPVVITDWTGQEISFTSTPSQVVALSGSLGEVWLNAGGTLVGTTHDAVTERQMELGERVAIVGTVKAPDLERVLALNPDFVILSADIAGHPDAARTLKAAGIPCGLFHEEYFADYLALLGQFTALTGRADLYEVNGLRVQQEIDATLAAAPDLSGRTVLLLRAYGSGFKAKGSDHLAGTVLRDFGLENILDKYDTLLEEISLEEILTVDPDYVFVTVMGSDTQGALAHLEGLFEGSGPWSTLTAVKEGRCHLLPRDLFHYKPNARWGESYRHILSVLAE